MSHSSSGTRLNYKYYKADFNDFDPKNSELARCKFRSTKYLHIPKLLEFSPNLSETNKQNHIKKYGKISHENIENDIYKILSDAIFKDRDSQVNFGVDYRKLIYLFDLIRISTNDLPMTHLSYNLSLLSDYRNISQICNIIYILDESYMKDVSDINYPYMIQYKTICDNIDDLIINNDNSKFNILMAEINELKNKVSILENEIQYLKNRLY